MPTISFMRLCSVCIPLYSLHISLYLLHFGVKSGVSACSVNGGLLTSTFEKVEEEQPTGTVIGSLRFDSPESVSSLHVLKSNAYFDLNTTTYNILVKERVDIDGSTSSNAQQPLFMQVRCTNRQNVAFDIDLWFYLEDINDNSPHFLPSSVYTFNVSETAAVASEVGQVSAADNDRDNLIIEYSIVQSEHAGYFTIRDKPGGIAALMLSRPLHFEKSQKMALLITATDCPHSGCTGQHRKTSTATIIINVSDADDQNPEFIGTPYEVSLVDTVVEESPVLQTRAQDLDTLNAPLRYIMLASSDSIVKASYQMHSLTGLLTVKNASLLRAGQLHLLQVRVYQENDYSKRDSTTVVVRILSSTNDAALQFEPKLYTVQVTEDTPVGTALISLKINDMNPGRNLRFGIRTTNGDDTFRIVAKRYNTGILYLKRPLDYEKQQHHHFSVEVSDGSQVDTASVTIAVIDTNDNNPEFTLPNYEFRVMVPPVVGVGGTLCGVVAARDRDNGTIITYRLISGLHKELFGITDSGSVVMTRSAAEYRTDAYDLTVLAADDGVPPRTAVATVSVQLARSAAGASSVLASYKVANKTEDKLDSYVVYALAAVAVALLAVVIVLVLYLARRKAKDTAKRMCTSPLGGAGNGMKGQAEKSTSSGSSQPLTSPSLTMEQYQSFPLLVKSTASINGSTKTASYLSEADSKHLPLVAETQLKGFPETFKEADDTANSTYVLRTKSPNGLPYTSLVYTRNGRTGISTLYGEQPQRQTQQQTLYGEQQEQQSQKQPVACTGERVVAKRRLIRAFSGCRDGEEVDSGIRCSDDDVLNDCMPLDGTPALPRRHITWDSTVYVVDDTLETSTDTKRSADVSSPTTTEAFSEVDETEEEDANSPIMSLPPSAGSRHRLIINL